MDKDGTKDGFDLDLLKKANDILNIPVIASGGAGNLKHFEEGVTLGGASALLAASVFHFAEFSILDVKRYLQKQRHTGKALNEQTVKELIFYKNCLILFKIEPKGKDKNSYTKLLLKGGKNKIAKKLGEESTELLIDYLNGTKKRTIEEASDLIYHLFVLLYSKKISLNDIKKELKKRNHVRQK